MTTNNITYSGSRKNRGAVKTDRPSRTTETTELGTLSDRPTRVPLSDARGMLTTKGLDPNYVYYWFHNTERRVTRLADAEAAGYEYVLKTEGVKIGACTVNASDGPDSVVTRQLGRGLVGYLMKQPREYYEEDLRKKRNARLDPKKHFDSVKQKLEGGFGELKLS